MFEIEQIAYDGAKTPDGWGAAKFQVDIAKLYARLGDSQQAIKHLEGGANATKAFDMRPEQQSYSSILFGNIEEKRSDFETSDTRPLTEIMRDKWLAWPDFDTLKETDEFKQIIKQLS